MSIQQVYDRAAADPDFADRLKVDFIGAAHEASIEVTADEIKAALGLEDASDEQAIDELQDRVSKSFALASLCVRS